MVADITNKTDNEHTQLLGDGDNRAGNPSTKQTVYPISSSSKLAP